MILSGSSALGLRIFGPKTVAKFWILILLALEYDCTSFKNLEQRCVIAVLSDVSHVKLKT